MTDDALETWSPAEVKAAMDRHEIVLIDVRTPQEYLFERIEGALLAPLSEFDPRNLPDQRGKRIVLHCGSDTRSGKAGRMCLSHGTGRMAHMKGGFAEWKAEGLPHLSTDLATGELTAKP